MTHFKIQEWPDMPGDGEQGDAIIFRSEYDPTHWWRYKSPYEAWCQLGGDAQPGDTVEVLPVMHGQRPDNYDGDSQ